MTAIQRSGGQIALFILSILGACIAIYLTSVHYENVPLVCSSSGIVDCARVLSSAFSVIPGTSVPITIPGLFWAIVSAALAFANWRLWPERRSLLVAAFAWSLLGLLTVFYLVYVELVRLHTICAWCTAMHVVILAIFLIALVLLQQPEPETEPDEEQEESPIPAGRD
ncbi:MAG TPA: vitamin K epoxide reductase family protein [Ktedonobacteraceae bacterium]|jgi:uncharacterized membrane protein|nr:vitamin K epoxide reductase family protein [Ktedonobacteraceae bacterium]